MSRYIPKKIKKVVVERANSNCEYCMSPASYSPTNFSFDHIVPITLTINHHPSNLAYACITCNSYKHDKIMAIDLLTKQKVAIYHPRKNYWLDHFKWNNDNTIIVGVTATGRATVELLRLNRTGNINLRQLLTLIGVHPPKNYPQK